MKVLKFGAKSLANGEGIQRVIDILSDKVKQQEAVLVVVSARGNATASLMELLEKAKKGEDYQTDFEAFKTYQQEPLPKIDFTEEFTFLGRIFEGVHLLGDYTLKIKDLVISYGELLSGKLVTALLKEEGVGAKYVDSRELFKTDKSYGEATLREDITKQSIKGYFGKVDFTKEVPVVTGFVGITLDG